jgi:hypothetical protein
MHDLDPAFRASTDARLERTGARSGPGRSQVWQSMYIFKQPGIGGEVRWHQDATYFDTDPISVTTFWFALEDATLDNGCMWAEPGGHRGPMRERFLRNGDELRMENRATCLARQQHRRAARMQGRQLVCFHGLLPHYSAPNRSPISRHAYTLHVTDGAPLLAAELDTARRQAARARLPDADQIFAAHWGNNELEPDVFIERVKRPASTASKCRCRWTWPSATNGPRASPRGPGPDRGAVGNRVP